MAKNIKSIAAGDGASLSDQPSARYILTDLVRCTP